MKGHQFYRYVFHLIISPDIMSINTLHLRLCLELFKTHVVLHGTFKTQKTVWCLQKHKIILQPEAASFWVWFFFLVLFYTDFEVSALPIHTQEATWIKSQITSFPPSQSCLKHRLSFHHLIMALLRAGRSREGQGRQLSVSWSKYSYWLQYW